jgi:hypothetical protein
MYCESGFLATQFERVYARLQSFWTNLAKASLTASRLTLKRIQTLDRRPASIWRMATPPGHAKNGDKKKFSSLSSMPRTHACLSLSLSVPCKACSPNVAAMIRPGRRRVFAARDNRKKDLTHLLHILFVIACGYDQCFTARTTQSATCLHAAITLNRPV